MKKVNGQLKLVYYLIYLIAIIVAFLAFFSVKSGWKIDANSEMGIYISQIFYLYLVVSIPITLAFFNKKVKQWALLEQVDEKLQLYKKAAIVRLSIIGSGFIIGLALFAIMQLQSMIFGAAISAIILLFCKPAEVKIITDLNLE